MSLVDYDSLSDSSDESPTADPIEISAPIANKATASSNLISNFLPAPKNTGTSSQLKSQVLGKAIRNTVNALVAVNPDGIVLPKSQRAVTSFVPSSVRNKINSQVTNAVVVPKEVTQEVKQAKNTHPVLKERRLPITAFQEVKSRTKVPFESNERIGIRSVDGRESPLVENQLAEQALLEKDKNEKTDVIKEFNMDTFYSENMEVKARGELRENKRLYSVSNAKNQLSSLIKNAQQNEDILQEKFERNKKARKERESRYGFR